MDNQGPTPGVSANSWLTLESPLDPFRLKNAGGERAYTSLDCINIERQLSYTYGDGSFPTLPSSLADPAMSTKVIRVAGINRARIRGSFLISAFATIDGNRHLVGTEAVLSRWNVAGCANCQTHIEAKAFLGLHPFEAKAVDGAVFEIEVRTRDGILKGPKGSPGGPQKLFQFGLR